MVRNTTMHKRLIFFLFPTLCVALFPSSTGGVLRRPKQKTPDAVVVPFPRGFIPFGPPNSPLSVTLRKLNGLPLPEAQHAWSGTLWAVPPMYYHLRTGHFIGAFALKGKVIKTTPVNIWRHRSRTLVAIRVNSIPGVQDVGYYPPKALRRRTRYLQPSTIQKLGIATTPFYVLTMDINDAAEPDRLAERSGLAATPREIRAYYRTKKSTFKQVQRDLRKLMGQDVVILSADGGATMGKPYDRRSKYAVTVGRRQSQKYAQAAP